MHIPTALCSILLFALASCSDSDPKTLCGEGYTAHNSGQYGDAKESFDAAIAQLEPTDELYVEARLGSCRAQAHIDPGAARDAFLALAEEHANALELGDYTMLLSELDSSKEYLVAVDVAHAGKLAYPESERMSKTMDDFVEKAKAEAEGGDSSVLDKLKGLGYVGED